MPQFRKSTEIRRKQILDAARKLIIRHGSEHLTVRRVASEVGLTEAALYRHFKSKREILAFLMKNVTESLLTELNRVASTGLWSTDELGEALRLHLSEIEQRKGMSFQILAEVISFGDRTLTRSVYEQVQSYIARIAGLLSDGAGKGFIRKDLDVDACATMLFGMIQGLVSMWAFSGYKFDLLKEYDSLWTIFRKSVEPVHPGKSSSTLMAQRA